MLKIAKKPVPQNASKEGTKQKKQNKSKNSTSTETASKPTQKTTPAVKRNTKTKPKKEEGGTLKRIGGIVLRLCYSPKKKTVRPQFSELVQVPEEVQPRTLEEEQYYHGYLIEKEVEAILKNEKAGKFLVRRAITYSGFEYVLSLRGEGEEMHHVLLNKAEERRLYWIDCHGFKSIQQLVDFYVDSQIPFRVSNPKTGEERAFTIKKPLKRLSWQINHEQIELDQVLGAGQFGEVYKGTLELSFGQGRKLVAIKIMKGDDLTTQQMYELIREANKMKKLVHPNVVRFYGVAVSKHPFMLALEFCHGGTLEGKLEEERIPDDQKVRYLYQAALGLEYLHDFEMVHGDVAARNCLLTKNNVVKIADFGLANDVGSRMKDGMLPMRAMSPEAIEKMKASKECDAWAFSILIFEMFHRAYGPFWEYSPYDSVVDLLKKDELHLYLFERPKKENLPPGITVNTKKWYKTLEKPQNPMLQKKIEILFNHLRFRNVKYRPRFPERSEFEHRKSIIGDLKRIMKEHDIES